MSASAAAPPSSSGAALPSFNWGCATWADCTCTLAEKVCKCEPASCGCGTITIEQMKEAMANACPHAVCSICKGSCKCNKACVCGGSKPKSQKQWVEWVKSKEPAGCKCTSAA